MLLQNWFPIRRLMEPKKQALNICRRPIHLCRSTGPGREKLVIQMRRCVYKEIYKFECFQKCPSWPNSSPNRIKELASHLRRTYLFDKLHFPTSVSSTPNAHFENRVSSRLHQVLAFFEIWRLVCTKHIFLGADPPSGGNQDVDFWNSNWKNTL